jgi:hypothetical protein
LSPTSLSHSNARTSVPSAAVNDLVRWFWAETERLLHPPEAAADPIHDLSDLDAEAERAALAEVAAGLGCRGAVAELASGARGALQWRKWAQAPISPSPRLRTEPRRRLPKGHRCWINSMPQGA